jgi:hypothetical protein
MSIVKPVIGQCRLCKNTRELNLGHIIPDFVVTWLKKSGGGALRSNEVPNRIIQDGRKEHLLCSECEQRFGDWEKIFSETVFIPYQNNSSTSPIRYKRWALQFAVSLSWRVLENIYPKRVNQFNQDEKQTVEVARETWRQFLLGEIEHPSIFEQHVIPLDLISNFYGPPLPPFINRYVVSTFDMALVNGGKTVFVYSKIAKLLIVGFIKYSDHDRKRWKGTKLHVNNGFFFGKKDYVVPDNIMNFIFGRSNLALKTLNSISRKQYGKVHTWIQQNQDAFIDTEGFRAMVQDVNFSGTKAALRPSEAKRDNEGEQSR